MALREKVEKIVRKKLAEYGGYDDDPYADEDPYMAGLEAEFPWLKDKKKKKSRKALGDEDAAMRERRLRRDARWHAYTRHPEPKWLAFKHQNHLRKEAAAPLAERLNRLVNSLVTTYTAAVAAAAEMDL